MKKIISLCLAALMLLTILPLSACEQVPTSIVLVKDSVSDFKIIRASGVSKSFPNAKQLPL